MPGIGQSMHNIRNLRQAISESWRLRRGRTLPVAAIGLYLDPPAKALVLCCDEKSQCQALERTQLSLPLAPKRPRTMTHDYTRHGTITLFAALDAMKGKLIARTEARHSRFVFSKNRFAKARVLSLRSQYQPVVR